MQFACFLFCIPVTSQLWKAVISIICPDNAVYSTCIRMDVESCFMDFIPVALASIKLVFQRFTRWQGPGNPFIPVTLGCLKSVSKKIGLVMVCQKDVIWCFDAPAMLVKFGPMISFRIEENVTLLALWFRIKFIFHLYTGNRLPEFQVEAFWAATTPLPQASLKINKLKINIGRQTEDLAITNKQNTEMEEMLSMDRIEIAQLILPNMVCWFILKTTKHVCWIIS